MEGLTPGWSRSEFYTNTQACFPSEGLKDFHFALAHSAIYKRNWLAGRGI